MLAAPLVQLERQRGARLDLEATFRALPDDAIAIMCGPMRMLEAARPHLLRIVDLANKAQDGAKVDWHVRDVVAKTMARYDGLPFDATSSLQRDVINGKPSELDAQLGDAILHRLQLGVIERRGSGLRRLGGPTGASGSACTAGPSGTTGAAASFSFSASQSPATFECRLDGRDRTGRLRLGADEHVLCSGRQIN